MKLLQLYIDGHLLELENDALGKETVIYDGKVKSSLRSMLGARHEFAVIERGEHVEYQVKFGFRDNYFQFSPGVNVWRNGKPLCVMMQRELYAQLKKCPPPDKPDESEFV